MAWGSLISSGGFVSPTIASIEQNRGQELTSLLSLRQLWCSTSIPYSLPRTAQLTVFVTITFIYLFSGGHVHAMTYAWMVVRGLFAGSFISLIMGFPGVPRLASKRPLPTEHLFKPIDFKIYLFLFYTYEYFAFIYGLCAISVCHLCVPSVCHLCAW